MYRGIVVVVALLVVTPFWLYAEAQKPKYEIKIESLDTSRFDVDKRITIEFKVIDPRTGKLASDLPKLEVIVEEDDIEVHREIWEPNHQPPAPPPPPPPEPIWTVMVLDRSGSMR